MGHNQEFPRGYIPIPECEGIVFYTEDWKDDR